MGKVCAQPRKVRHAAQRQGAQRRPLAVNALAPATDDVGRHPLLITDPTRLWERSGGPLIKLCLQQVKLTLAVSQQGEDLLGAFTGLQSAQDKIAGLPGVEVRIERLHPRRQRCIHVKAFAPTAQRVTQDAPRPRQDGSRTRCAQAEHIGHLATAAGGITGHRLLQFPVQGRHGHVQARSGRSGDRMHDGLEEITPPGGPAVQRDTALVIGLEGFALLDQVSAQRRILRANAVQ